MNWALIENNVVVEVTDIDPTGRFHPDISWKSCGDEITVGWLYIKGNFSKPEISSEYSSLNERVWRNEELKRADYELNKVQDSDPNSTGTVALWREYRKALRHWPENPDFPNTNKRPTAPL